MNNFEGYTMKRLLSLILFIGSFAGAMDAPAAQEQKMTAKQAPQIPSLLALCANKIAQPISNMSLAEYLQSRQPKLPEELDAFISSKILNDNQLIMAIILKRINTPYLHTLTGHTTPIRSAIISPDNTFIVTGSDDGTVKIWNAKTGECRRTINSHSDPIISITISHDSSFIVTSSGKYDRIHDVNTGRPLHLFPSTKKTRPTTSLAISPDNTFIVTSLCDRTATVWDMGSFNAACNNLRKGITIPGALLLKEWYDAQEFIIENEQVKGVFDSLPEQIKQIMEN